MFSHIAQIARYVRFRDVWFRAFFFTLIVSLFFMNVVGRAQENNDPEIKAQENNDPEIKAQENNNPEIIAKAKFQLALVKSYRQVANYPTTSHSLSLRRKAALVERGITIQPDIPEAIKLPPHIKNRIDGYLQRLELIIDVAKIISGPITSPAAMAQAHYDCMLGNIYASKNDQAVENECRNIFIRVLRDGEAARDDIDLEAVLAERNTQRIANLNETSSREGTKNTPFNPSSAAAIRVEEWYSGRDDYVEERYIALEEILSNNSAAAGIDQIALLGALKLAEEIAARETLSPLSETLNRASGPENAYLAETEGSNALLTLPAGNKATLNNRNEALARAENSDTVSSTETLLSEKSTIIPDENVQSIMALLEKEESQTLSSINQFPRIASLGNEKQAIIWVLHFDYESTVLNQESLTELPNIVKTVQGLKNPVILVFGYTDSKGDARFNLNFSKKRARNVRKILVDKGLTGSSIIAHGFGEERPIVKTEDGVKNDANRRVIITVLH